MRRLWLMCLLLWGCQQTAPSIPGSLPQWHDQYFLTKPDLPSADEVFNLPADLTSQLRKIPYQRSLTDRLDALLALLFLSSKPQMQYHPSYTLTPSQLWQTRAGNCLSLAILTTASASFLGLTAQLQTVVVTPRWSREGSLMTVSEHINLRVMVKPYLSNGKVSQWRVVDFQDEYRRYWPSATLLDKNVAIALFYHNLAADFVREKRLSEAYWAVKAALQRYPQSVSSWNLLGVLYRRAGLGQPALAAYQYALTLEPEAPAIWQNLAVLYQQLAMPAKAADASAKAQALAPKNPYRYIDLANKALDDGQLAAAEQGYRQALAIDDINDEALWGMAQLYLARGERQEALRWLKKALAMAASEELLQRIKAWQQQHRL